MSDQIQEGSPAVEKNAIRDRKTPADVEQLAYDVVLAENQHVWRYPVLAIRDDWPPKSRALPETYSDDERRDFFAFWRDVDHAGLILGHVLTPPEHRSVPLQLSRVQDRMLLDRLERARLAGHLLGSECHASSGVIDER